MRHRKAPGTEDPKVLFTHLLVSGSPDGLIEAQEASGQKSLVESDTLPTEVQEPYGKSKGFTKAALERWGVKFHDRVKGDDIFQYVTLPKGWKKVETDHSMWSNLVDDKRRTRAAIFYKAAFYDRSAYFSLNRRFVATCDFSRMNKTGEVVGIVTDDGKIIYTTGIRHCQATRRDGSEYEITDAATKDAKDWLNKNYPEWDDPTKYWED